jgi:hypothetical protein
MEAGNAIECSANGRASRLQIMTGLGLSQNSGSIPKKKPQPQCGVRAYAKLLTRNAFDARARRAARPGHSIGRQSHRLEKLLAQHLTGMQRRQASHDNELLWRDSMSAMVVDDFNLLRTGVVRRKHIRHWSSMRIECCPFRLS